MLSDLQTKHEKLAVVAQNYNIDANRAKEYIAATKTTNVPQDRLQIEYENKLSKA